MEPTGLVGVGVGGQGDDGGMAGGAFELADLAGGGDAVHARHLDVHQDDVEAAGAGGFDGLDAVDDGLGGAVEHFAQGLDHHAVGGVVVDHQDVGGAAAGLFGLDRLVGGGRGRLQGDLEADGGAGAGVGFGRQASAHGAHGASGQGQAQGHAQGGAGGGQGAVVEQAGQIGGVVEGAVVAHAAVQADTLFVDFRLQAGLDHAVASVGHGVADQGVEDLDKAGAVGHGGAVGVAVVGHQQGQARGLGAVAPAGLDLVHQVLHPARLGIQRQLGRLGPLQGGGGLQKVEHAVAGLGDGVQAGGGVFRQAEAAHPLDGGQGAQHRLAGFGGDALQKPNGG